VSQFELRPSTLPDGSVMIVEPGFADAFMGLLEILQGKSHE
jgi:hypothetical protein